MTHLENYISVVEFFYEQDEVIDPHSSIWGDFNFCLNGILEYEIEGLNQLSPPSYGIWIPPHTAHHCIAVDQNKTHYVGIRIHPSLCTHFSNQSEILAVRPFFRNLVEEILAFQSASTHIEHYRNLLRVLFDQLVIAPKYNHYLPKSHHPILSEVLTQLSKPENLALPLQSALKDINMTERHLLRLCRQELDMGLSEWRNRAKILYAVTQLRQGHSIKKISYLLGYKHPSSFIEFFKRHTGQTPNKLKSI